MPEDQANYVLRTLAGVLLAWMIFERRTAQASVGPIRVRVSRSRARADTLASGTLHDDSAVVFGRLELHVGLPGDFGVRGGCAVSPRNRDEQAMGRRLVVAGMRDLSRDDVGTQDVPMHERARRSAGLTPMHLAQVAQPDFRHLPSVPLPLHADHRLVE